MYIYVYTYVYFIKNENGIMGNLAPRTLTLDTLIMCWLFHIVEFNNHNKTEAETTENKKIYRKKNKQK